MEETKSSSHFNEQLIALREKHRTSDEMESIATQFLKEEPDNLDAHAWFAVSQMKINDPKIFKHFRYVFDRDINYQLPGSNYRNKDDIVDDFLIDLHARLHRSDLDDEQQIRNKRKIAKLIVSYTENFLQASRKIHSITDFAEALNIIGRYDDVISIAFFLSGRISADDLKWKDIEYSKDSDDVDEIVTNAIDAFFLSKRYAEGCAWIKELLEKKPDYDYLWYLFGQTLCWLGYPQETARTWIIALKKGWYAFDMYMEFEILYNIILDPDYLKKEDISYRLNLMKRTISEDKKEILSDLDGQVFGAIKNRDQELPSIDFIETKLETKIPCSYSGPSDKRYFFPKKRSSDPVVAEAIAFIDRCIGTVHSNTDLETDDRKKEKVTVGSWFSQPSGHTLEQFGVDLTKQAASGKMAPIIGRDKEIERMIRILSRTEKNNPVLLGEAGVGKTAVVQGLAQRIVRGEVPDTLKNKMIIELNVGVLVAGTTYRGDFERRMEEIVKEVKENQSIILFIDELHTLMGAGGSKHGLDGSNILKPALATGDLRLIGATTTGEYARSIEKDPAMERRFSPIYLSEIDQQMTREVLLARKPFWESHHGLKLSDDIFDTAIELSDRHIRHRHFPDKAIDVIDEACAMARMEIQQGSDDNANVTVNKEHIIRVIDQMSGTEENAPVNGGGSLLNVISDSLRKKLSVHENIIDRLALIAADQKLGLRRSSLPRIVCFAGEPQSGKTEAARALADTLWLDEKDRFLFINMAMFTDETDLNRLIGSRSGYIGSEVGATLPLHLKQHPKSIVYLYQFNRAHQKVIDFFINLFSEGSFPDPDGKTIYTSNTIFIPSLTLESNRVTLGFGKKPQTIATNPNPDKLKELLAKNGIPEKLIHLLKEILWFDSMNQEQVEKIIKRELHTLVNQPWVSEMNLDPTEELVKMLTTEYFEQPALSRNLRSLINKGLFEIRISAH